ncbi:YraN family protein [bacterium]|nr:MAG: YraN family protein [bacterium]
MAFLRTWFLRPPDLAGLKLGEAGELWAGFLYRKNGFKIISRNYALFGTKKLGEIDIVCARGRRLVFVEVKTRADENYMKVVEAVDFRKQSYLRRMAKLFLQANPQYQDYEFQIDVAAILMDPFDNTVKSVKIIENAVEDSQ